jgi:multidrug efflux pump subunit AcrA (membrane-fusion protein)
MANGMVVGARIFRESEMRLFIAGIASALIAADIGAQTPDPASQGSMRTFRGGDQGKAVRDHECLVEAFMVVNVGSPVDGVLEQVLVNRGDRVRKGQVVARLQSGVEVAAVQLSKARVDFGRRRLERNEILYEKELKREEEALKLRTIVSPIDGVVVERRLVPGEFIRSDKSVVLKLAQINPLNVEVVAPASLFGTVRVGSSGKVNLAPFLPGIFNAKVVVVDKVIDAASGTLGIRLQLPNPDNKIPAGIKCSVQFGT